jgi:outer membrane protein assembly factor BamE (lipoprotein component of BamABCDE complex)
MKISHKLALTIVFALLGGCFSVGAQVDEQQVETLRKGETTYAQVVQRFGPPTSQTMSSEGGRTAYWTYVQATPRAATFIPIVGAFAGGSDTKSNVVMTRFDSNGILQDFSSTTSQMGAATGISSGADMGRVPDQPRQAPSN